MEAVTPQTSHLTVRSHGFCICKLCLLPMWCKDKRKEMQSSCPGHGACLLVRISSFLSGLHKLSHPYLPHQRETLRLRLSIRPAPVGVESSCTLWGSELKFAALAMCRQLACSRWLGTFSPWAAPCLQLLATHGTRSSWGPGRDFQRWPW